MKEKIICEYCGTIYEATEECCPLCSTKPETDHYMGDHFDFDERPMDDEDEAYEDKPRGRGVKITALIVLLLLFIGFAGYIAYSFELIPFLQPPEAPVADLSCTGLRFSADSVALSQTGMTAQLKLISTPQNTTDAVTYKSADESIVTVTQEGVVTAVGPGNTTIEATCGQMRAVCEILCTFAEETPEPTDEEPESEPDSEPIGPLEISATDISFFANGESTALTVTGAGDQQIIWESSDESVATVDETGCVVAVSSGTATITATVGDQSVSCIVRCNY